MIYITTPSNPELLIKYIVNAHWIGNMTDAFGARHDYPSGASHFNLSQSNVFCIICCRALFFFWSFYSCHWNAVLHQLIFSECTLRIFKHLFTGIYKCTAHLRVELFVVLLIVCFSHRNTNPNVLRKWEIVAKLYMINLTAISWQKQVTLDGMIILSALD
jgi:hypothetical protein